MKGLLFLNKEKNRFHSFYQFQKFLSEMAITDKTFLVLHLYFSTFLEILLDISIPIILVFYHIPKK